MEALILQLLPFTVFALFCTGFGFIQSVEHNTLIRIKQMTARVKRQWTAARFVIVGVMSAAGVLTGVFSILVSVLAFIGANGAFSSMFRRRLNKLEKWPALYVGVTSWYDLRLIATIAIFETGAWPNLPAIRVAHQSMWGISKDYRRTVARAAMLAYTLEITMALIGAAALLMAQHR